MNDALFAELLESVREGGAILRGERAASRTLFVTDQRPVSDDPELAPAPTPYPFKWTRRVVILLACLFLSVLAGGITSIVITNVDSAGYFVRWQRLPDPPAAVTSLNLSVPNEFAVPVVQLASGDYASLPFGEDAWIIGDSLPTGDAAACPRSLPALAWTTRPPAGLTGCIHYLARGDDCHVHSVFALDGDGRVWQWINTGCALATLGVAFFTFVASGLVYLLLFSLLALMWLRRRERAGR